MPTKHYRHRGAIEAWQWRPGRPIPNWIKYRFEARRLGSGRWMASTDGHAVRPGDYIVRQESTPYKIKTVWRQGEFEEAFEEMSNAKTN